jgi:hypothetical protein
MARIDASACEMEEAAARYMTNFYENYGES